MNLNKELYQNNVLLYVIILIRISTGLDLNKALYQSNVLFYVISVNRTISTYHHRCSKVQPQQPGQS